jgi:hypothetical protein
LYYSLTFSLSNYSEEESGEEEEEEEESSGTFKLHKSLFLT